MPSDKAVTESNDLNLSISAINVNTRSTVKKAVELLDAPSKNTLLKSNKYNSIVEIVYLDTHVFFPHSVIE